MKSINIRTILSNMITGLKRYSVTIFIVLLVSSLVTAVLLLNQVVLRSSDTTGVTSNLDSNTFDQDTINRIEQLHTSTEYSESDTILPDGRINPFAE